MSRFQSYLFRWLERSFPVQLGRKARRVFDRLTTSLVEKLSQTVSVESNQVVTPPSPMGKLLQPVMSLVKQVISNYLQHRSTTANNQLASPISADLDQVNSSPAQEIIPTNKLTRRRIKLEEIMAWAMAYFTRKKHLPPTKADRIAMYEEIYEDQTVYTLTANHPHSSESNITPDDNDQILESWEQELESYSMRAWIETQAIPLGYVESPIIKFLLWLDKIIAKVEQWLINLWHRLFKWYLKLTDRG